MNYSELTGYTVHLLPAWDSAPRSFGKAIPREVSICVHTTRLPRSSSKLAASFRLHDKLRSFPPWVLFFFKKKKRLKSVMCGNTPTPTPRLLRLCFCIWCKARKRVNAPAGVKRVCGKAVQACAGSSCSLRGNERVPERSEKGRRMQNPMPAIREAPSGEKKKLALASAGLLTSQGGGLSGGSSPHHPWRPSWRPLAWLFRAGSPSPLKQSPPPTPANPCTVALKGSNHVSKA